MRKTTTAGLYVLLPPKGLRAKARTASPEVREFLQSAHEATGTHTLSIDSHPVEMRVVDSLGPDGAKLVELSPDSALAIRALRPGVRVVPVVSYMPAVVPRKEVKAASRTARAGRQTATAITLQVVSGKGGSPVANAFVVAFTDFAANLGVQGVTAADGTVSLDLGGPSVTLDRLYVYPLDANWSIVKKGLTVTTGTTVTLTPLDLSYTDGLRCFYGNAEDSVGAGVTVGLIDTGVAAHPDLVIAGGANTVPGEDPTDFGDNGRAHGTHVAGILAARGTPPTGLRGVAPGVTLRSYRVFGEGQGSATNFAIAKGIDQAVADRCYLVSISFGGGAPDPLVQAAIDDARVAGTVCIVAAGNGGRAPISFPASEDLALAVSAMGRKGTFPTSAAATDEIAAPYGTDSANFLAALSNVGPQMDLTAPGVGIMSTVPGGYAEISGTAMACAAATGAAARAIAGTDVMQMTRNATRFEAIVKAVLGSATSLGFGPEFEGHGLPQPG